MSRRRGSWSHLGEHNDVYRHLVRDIRAADGSLLALVGVAYSVNPALGGTPDLGWIVKLLGVVLRLGVYWLALPCANDQIVSLLGGGNGVTH